MAKGLSIPPPPEPFRSAREARNRRIWRAQRKQEHFDRAAKRRAIKHRARYSDTCACGSGEPSGACGVCW